MEKVMDSANMQRIKQKIAYLASMSKDDTPNIVQDTATVPDSITCTKCHNTGFIETVDAEGYPEMVRCPECYERRMLFRRLKNSGVSAADYARYTLQAFDASRSTVAATMKQMAERYIQQYKNDGHGFGLFGASGLGKTHLCIAVCQELTARYRVPHYYFSYRTEMPELIKSMKGFGVDYDEKSKKWKTCPNLYIDDLFKFAGKIKTDEKTHKGKLISLESDDAQVMFDIINTRNLNHLTTLFSSEYSVKDIIAVDPALGSRIFQMVSPFALGVDGKNQRIGA